MEWNYIAISFVMREIVKVRAVQHDKSTESPLW